MSDNHKQFASFQQTKIINGDKVHDKKILISINPDDKQKIYGYFKIDNDQYLYSDKLHTFFHKINSDIQSNSQFDLIQTLKSDLEYLNTPNSLDKKIKFLPASQLSKKNHHKKFKKIHLHDDFIILQPRKDLTKKTQQQSNTTFKLAKSKNPKKSPPKKPPPKKSPPKKPPPKKSPPKKSSPKKLPPKKSPSKKPPSKKSSSKK